MVAGFVETVAVNDNQAVHAGDLLIKLDDRDYRALLARAPKGAEIALIFNPRMDAPEFMLTICEELGVMVPNDAIGSLKDLVDILNAYLLRAHADGRRVVAAAPQLDGAP